MNDKIYNYGYRAPRFRADFRLLLQPDHPHSVLIDARCTDLSVDGLSAESKAALGIGALVTLVLTLPGTAISRRIAARVTNCKANGHGFAFIFSSHQEQSFLCEYLESQRSTMVRSPELSGEVSE